jgi:hypothetical protein
MLPSNPPGTSKPQVITARLSIWIWLSISAVVLALVGNVIGLTQAAIYAGLSPAFLPQAYAQDFVSIALISPLWLVLAFLALRRSLRAYLLWLGVLAFTVYNYVIYTFSVPFGPLFPLWVAVLGLSLYSLIGGLASLDHPAVKSAFRNQKAVLVSAWALIVVGILFAFLWLSEDIPALLGGFSPRSVVDMNLPTNPVHVLDLAFFLPAVFITSAFLLRHKPLGYSLAPAFLVFLILTGLPILATPLAQTMLGLPPSWGVVIPIGILILLMLALLAWLISTVKEKAFSEVEDNIIGLVIRTLI